MKPVVTFRTGAALAHDCICLAGALDALDANEPYTRVFIYDEQDKSLWFHYEEEHKVVAIRTWSDPIHGHKNFITMSNEGDVAFVGEEATIEKIPEAGVFSDDAKGWGYMSAFRQIDGLLYAVGGGGQIYKRAASGQWGHMDTGILQSPSVKDRLLFTDINGPHSDDIYVCGDIPSAYGLAGQLYHWNGLAWNLLPTPSSERLTSIHVQKSGDVWVCGANGTLMRGDWKRGFIDVSTVDDNQLFYSLTELDDIIYLASNFGLFMFDGKTISEVATGLNPELQDAHVIQSIDNVLWSIGFKDIARFDGSNWKRIDHPSNPPIG